MMQSWSSLFQSPRTINLVVPNYLADPDYLTATQFKGIEGLSCDFEYVVTLLSSLPFDVEKWLGQLLAVQIAPDTFTSRFFHGMVQRVVQGDYTAAPNGDNTKLRQYQLILKPSFSKLKLRRDCRIFQKKNVIDIVKELCHEAFIYNIDTSHLKVSNYPKLEYCVQYNETTYDFLHCLLSEAGIYYTYNHSQTQHELVLYPVGDASASPRDLLYHKAQDWQSLMNSYPNSTKLTGWKGGLTSQGLKAEGVTTFLDLKPNDRVNVYGDVLRSDAENDQPPYHVVKVFHEAQDTTRHAAMQQNELPVYRNRFKVSANPFNPPVYPKPRVGGPQSAVVTGPKGRAIYTNKHGAVKVKFPWDRKNPANESSSKWIPVTQLLSGQGWGTQFIPRVGDEVIVDFIDDDPNQPVVIGSAYNAANPLLFPRMNGKEVQSGYQTFLMGAYGEALETPQTGHTLLFDDTAGQEKIVLKSAGNISLRVHNNLTQTISGNETVTAGTNIFIQAQKGAANIKAKKIVVNAGASSMVLDDSGIHFKPAGKLLLKAKGVGGHYGVARVNDTHDCPNPLHGSGQQVSQGSPTFQIGGQPAARVDDPISCPADNTITSGANNILVDGKPLANANSQTADGGKLTSFAPNVMVADRAAVSNPIDNPKIPALLPQEHDDKFDIQTLHISEHGKQFIFAHEGFRSHLYNDVAGNCTIGYGHLVHNGNKNNKDPSEKPYLNGITQAQGETLFNTDIIKYENIVKNSGINVKVTQNQFDALVSFVYNIGHVPEKTVTAINTNDDNAAGNNMKKYDKTRNPTTGQLVEDPALKKRREDEVALFNT